MTLRGLALSTLLLSLPSISQALTLDCQLKTNASAGGYVTDRYVLQYDEATGEAIVSDGLILYFNDNQPMKAKVSEDTAKKLVLSWSVQVTNNTGQIAKMLFRAAYFKADGALSVRAIPSGFSDLFEARGSCKKV